MAIEAGTAAMSAATAAPGDVRWVIHGGTSLQGAVGWPLHHAIQHGVVGAQGNSLEVKQYCAGGLTSWLLASGLLDPKGAAICTGADNWSWGDRFVTSRSDGGEPFSDVAHAAVLSTQDGFAQILGSGTASCPSQANAWQPREPFWESTTLDDYRRTFSCAAEAWKAEWAQDSFRMLVDAVETAMTAARISPQYVTHFVQPAGSGGLYRSLARTIDLPWSDSLCEHYLDCGYLGTSSAVAGMMHFAKAGDFAAGSIALLLAVEYQMSATAVILRITRRPKISVSDVIGVAS
ncbi:hypothetical protein ACAG26_07725 [Mycobacterium sp. pUA109]|uniref:hypothetical protein n=1 Tax=Mycobacterium sp. pUA109 TaxID=3238982 RepID=UPI00351B7DE0